MQQNNRIIKAVFILIFVSFAALFFYKEQYWPCVIILVLVLVAWRVDDLIRISVTKGGIEMNLNKEHKEIEKIIRSNQSVEQKVEASQEFIDEVFQLGYTMGGGKIRGKISNVKIWESNNGGKNIQYDEQ